MFSGRIATSTGRRRQVRRESRCRAGGRTASTLPTPSRMSITLPGTQIDEAHEVGDQAIGRPRIDLERRAVLLQPAAVDHRDMVGERQRLGLVVGDIDEGDAGAALQALELDAHLLAQLGVEIGERLVEQQDLGLDHQAAGERDALLLAARQLVRIARREPGEVDERQRLLDLLPGLRRRRLPDLEAKHDVLVYGLVRPHRIVLEHHAHAALIRRGHAAGRGDEPVADMDGAGVGHDIARDHAQGRGLAAAARAEQRDELIVLDVEIEIGDRRRRVVARVEALGQALERDARHYEPSPCRCWSGSRSRRRRACWRSGSRRR